MDFVSFMTDIGTGFGNFINALANPTGEILLVLGVVAFCLTFFMVIVTVVTGFRSNNNWN
jgi:hypothetical protein